jgi:NADH-quinone oxidoreductase subunit E
MTGSILNLIESYPCGKREYLIPILQAVQERQGYLSKEVITAIGRHLDLPASKIYGVATFYNQFRFKPLGKYHITICRGTACHVKGSGSVLNSLTRSLGIRPGDTTNDGLFSLEVVACIGACGLAPVMVVNDQFHAGISPESVESIIAAYRGLEPNGEPLAGAEG